MKIHYDKIIVVLATLVIGMSGFYMYADYQDITKIAIENKKNDTKAYILEQTSKLIRTEDFSSKDVESQNEVFKNFWNTIQSPDTVRIKVWDSNYTVVWSELKDLIGQSFKDNHEMSETLGGETVLEFADEGKGSEYFSERQYKSLVEIYVPIVDNDGKIAGVIEVYQYGGDIKQKINDNFKKAAIPTAIMTVIILAILSLLFFLIRKNIKHEF